MSVILATDTTMLIPLFGSKSICVRIVVNERDTPAEIHLLTAIGWRMIGKYHNIDLGILAAKIYAAEKLLQTL